MNPAIPPVLQDRIANLVRTLEQLAPDDLVSIILYGGMVKNDLVKDTDTIKLMVVVKEINTTVLDRLAVAFRKKSRTGQLQPLVLSEEDLRSSTDVFPIKFLDMQQDYELLSGKDVMKGLEIKREHLRLRCEQEIKNLMLRLRRLYVMGQDGSNPLSQIMLRAYFAFLSSLDVLAELKTDKVYRRDDEILEAAAGLGLNVEPLRRIHGIRLGRELGGLDEEKKVYNQLMATVRQAAAMVDRI